MAVGQSFGKSKLLRFLISNKADRAKQSDETLVDTVET